MDLTTHSTFLPHDDPEASLAFWRDALGFEVRDDVGYGGMRWIIVGPPGQPGTSIVLHPPGAAPGITDDERRTIAEMMAKGTYASINLAAADLDGTFERLQASDAEVVQEPTEQPYGVRDCALRDPAGNLIREALRRDLSSPCSTGSAPLQAALSLGHHMDHLIRGNAVGWPLTEEVNAFDGHRPGTSLGRSWSPR
jgi:uncharacterized glyoxalase superfamily protein PhnB